MTTLDPRVKARIDLDVRSTVFTRECYERGCLKEAERAAVLVEHYRFLLNAAVSLYNVDKEIPECLAPIFYHTLSYECDVELVNKVKSARKSLDQYLEGK